MPRDNSIDEAEAAFKREIEEKRVNEMNESIAMRSYEMERLRYQNEELNYFERLTEPNYLPEHFKAPQFGLFDKNTILSNYDNRTLKIALDLGNTTILDRELYIPPEEYNPQFQTDQDNARMLHFKMTLRGLNSKERTLQKTSITKIERDGGQPVTRERKRGLFGLF